MKFTCTSPCKLNEFLYITGKRPDGYHDLQTLFTVLDYGDEMSFEVTDDGRVDLITPFPFPKEENLIYRAAMALKPLAKSSCGCIIAIEKKLPEGGGLGGGSGNAATTLQVLNRLWDLRLGKSDLIALAVKLGADVPIFIEGVSCFGEGIGEILTPVAWNRRWYLVANPGCKVPTAKLFASDRLRKDSPVRTLDELMSVPFENCFTPVVTGEYPQVAKLLEILGKLAPDARMSGSGSSCFVSFTSKEDATWALDELGKYGDFNAFIAPSCERNTVIAALDGKDRDLH